MRAKMSVKYGAGLVVLCLLLLLMAQTEAADASGASSEAAATDTNVVLKLHEIVVLGTRIPLYTRSLTSPVQVIGRDQIDRSNTDYVMDAIQNVPGVHVRKDAIYGRQDVVIRGLGSNLRRIQTLIDGRPEKMSFFGCTISQTLPLANVERVEVLRGPESVLYGSDAMGGVVNIVTRRRHEPGYEADASIQYGSYATLHGIARHGGKIDDFDYYMVYDRKQTDGHRPNSEYSADFGALKLGYELNDFWRLEAAGQYLADMGYDPGPISSPYTNNDRRQYKRGSWNVTLSGDDEDNRWLLQAYQNYGVHKFTMPSIADYWHSKDQTVGAKVEYSKLISIDDELEIAPTVGYDYQYIWAKPQTSWVRWAKENMPARFMNFDSNTQHNHDIYVFNDLTLGRWHNTLGVRAHYDDVNNDVAWLPHVGILRHLTETTTLRAKIARGFRQPRFNELYLFPAHNDDLDPEDVWGYDLGLRQAIGDCLSFEINPFYQRVGNTIQTVANDDPPPQAVNQNSGAYDVRGVEVAAEYQPVNFCQLGLAYTYTDVEDARHGDPHTNRQGVPEHEISATMEYTIKKIRLAAEARYVIGLYDSDVLGGGNLEKLDDYFLVNVKGVYSASEHTELFVGIDNLLDRNYEQIPGYPMPGVTGYMGLSLRI